MKRVILLLLLWVGGCSGLWAQEYPSAHFYTATQEEDGGVRLSSPSGFEPHFLDFDFPNSACRYEIRVSVCSTSDGSEDPLPTGGYSAWNDYDLSHYQIGKEWRFQSPRLSLGLNLNRYFQLSFTGGVNRFHQNLYNKLTGKPERSLNKTSLWTSTVARCNYLSYQYMRAYLGLGLDMGFTNHNGSRESVAAVCLNLGATFGARIFGFWDISVSSEYIAAGVGLGYRF